MATNDPHRQGRTARLPTASARRTAARYATGALPHGSRAAWRSHRPWHTWMLIAESRRWTRPRGRRGDVLVSRRTADPPASSDLPSQSRSGRSGESGPRDVGGELLGQEARDQLLDGPPVLESTTQSARRLTARRRLAAGHGDCSAWSAARVAVRGVGAVQMKRIRIRDAGGARPGARPAAPQAIPSPPRRERRRQSRPAQRLLGGAQVEPPRARPSPPRSKCSASTSASGSPAARSHSPARRWPSARSARSASRTRPRARARGGTRTRSRREAALARRASDLALDELGEPVARGVAPRRRRRAARATPPRQNTSPKTLAARSTRRASGSSASRRACDHREHGLRAARRRVPSATARISSSR